MKALIRNKEFYPETAWSAFTRNHLEWHCTANPDGDGYALAENCPKDAAAEDFDIIFRNGVGTATLNMPRYNARIAEEAMERSATVIIVEDDSQETVVIDGKEYTKEELRALLGE